MATHSSVLAWRIPGMGELGGLPSMGLHRVGHDWSDLAAATWIYMDFSGGSVVENLPAHARDADMGLIPGSGRSSRGGNDNPLQYSCWKIPWTEDPGGLQSRVLQRVRHDWGTLARTYLLRVLAGLNEIRRRHIRDSECHFRVFTSFFHS